MIAKTNFPPLGNQRYRTKRTGTGFAATAAF
jgi:hypothetical protein